MAKNYSNGYIFTYAAVLVIIVAAILASAATFLKPIQKKNVRVEKMQNILLSVGIQSTRENAEEQYQKFIGEKNAILINSKGEQEKGNAFDVDMKKLYEEQDLTKRKLPLYKFEKNGKINYIIPLRGKGLWGPIWGFMALEDDANTIKGIIFDHSKETPGLGAEISTSDFEKLFKGKKLFNDSGVLTSVRIVKGGGKDDLHKVDAISGGTITSMGVDAMLIENLKGYENFLKSLKK